MKKLKGYHYFDKVYRQWVVIFIGPVDEFRKEMGSIGYPEDYIIDSNGMCINLNPDNNSMGNDSLVLWMKKFDRDTLVHEIVHLVMYVFDDLGIPISLENTESFAHYTEHWYREIQQLIKQYPKGKSSKRVLSEMKKS